VQLELTLRTCDITKIVKNYDKFEEGLKNSKKSFLFIFNEYKIVLESVLYDNLIPFNVIFINYSNYLLIFI
jgi:hypothetical protein